MKIHFIAAALIAVFIFALPTAYAGSVIATNTNIGCVGCLILDMNEKSIIQARSMDNTVSFILRTPSNYDAPTIKIYTSEGDSVVSTSLINTTIEILGSNESVPHSLEEVDKNAYKIKITDTQKRPGFRDYYIKIHYVIDNIVKGDVYKSVHIASSCELCTTSIKREIQLSADIRIFSLLKNSILEPGASYNKLIIIDEPIEGTISYETVAPVQNEKINIGFIFIAAVIGLIIGWVIGRFDNEGIDHEKWENGIKTIKDHSDNSMKPAGEKLNALTESVKHIENTAKNLKQRADKTEKIIDKIAADTSEIRINSKAIKRKAKML
ncbi:MAG: hypothetical protein J4473_04025 [Candidatus Aenigmarchaeota archaeon]|nr:hypothetical protein [Candidatus Aenigmarchaeota archaeon]